MTLNSLDFFDALLAPQRPKCSAEDVQTLLHLLCEVDLINCPVQALATTTNTGFQQRLMTYVAGVSNSLRKMTPTVREEVLDKLHKHTPLIYALIRYNDDRVTGAMYARCQEITAFEKTHGSLPSLDGPLPVVKAAPADDQRFLSEVEAVSALTDAVRSRNIRTKKPPQVEPLETSD